MLERWPRWTRRRGGAKAQRQRQHLHRWKWRSSKPRSSARKIGLRRQRMGPPACGANFVAGVGGGSACLMGGNGGWRTLVQIK
eukprot:4493721-Prymnesium_polylepis.1